MLPSTNQTCQLLRVTPAATDIQPRIYSDSLSEILSEILSDMFSDILSSILSDILSDMVSDIPSDMRSDILSDILHSQLRSGSAHWDLVLAVEQLEEEEEKEKEEEEEEEEDGMHLWLNLETRDHHLEGGTNPPFLDDFPIDTSIYMDLPFHVWLPEGKL